MFLLNRIAVILCLWGLAQSGVAATVYSCSKSGSKCIIKMQEGIVGDTVRVLDEKARVVGQGRVIKRKRAFGVIKLNPPTKGISKGYPVIVNVERKNSSIQWAASFSDKEE